MTTGATAAPVDACAPERAGADETRARADVAMRRATPRIRFVPSIVMENVAMVMHTDTHVSTIDFLHTTGRPITLNT